MSTAGKVLTVLILLAMVGWIVVLSAVTQLNVNWQNRIAQGEKDANTAQDRATKAINDAYDLTARTKAEQTAKDRDLREILGRTIAVEGRLSIKNEESSRVQFQLADYQAAVERAKQNQTTREAERLKVEQDLAAKKTEVAQKQDENAKLRDQLAKLQTDFKRLLTDNSRRLGKDGDSRPASRPASERRPAPAS